jgi:glycosidase
MNHAAVSWWREGILYQIYPRSFQDSNGDGIGDISGIIDRLPYLRALGIDAIWLSPIFPSPMADFGYDISNYAGVDPIFGTLDDFDMLVSAAHEYGLRVILDLVPNHTSDQHPWFIESRSSRDNPKRDWVGFRRYWCWKSRSRGGRPQIETELRALIRQMSTENQLWGAPRIHGELLKLGFSVAQSTVATYMVKLASKFESCGHGANMRLLRRRSS